MGAAGLKSWVLSLFLLKIFSAKREREDGAGSSGASSDTFPPSEVRDILVAISLCWGEEMLDVNQLYSGSKSCWEGNSPKSTRRIDNNQAEI